METQISLIYAHYYQNLKLYLDDFINYKSVTKVYTISSINSPHRLRSKICIRYFSLNLNPVFLVQHTISGVFW